MTTKLKPNPETDTARADSLERMVSTETLSADGIRQALVALHYAARLVEQADWHQVDSTTRINAYLLSERIARILC